MTACPFSGVKVKTVPDHVPDNLVVDIDIYDLPGGGIDPQLAWTAFNRVAKGPLVWSPYNGGHWVATDSADISKFLRDAERLSSQQITLPDRGGPRLVPLEADAPDHSTYRKNILPFFTAQALRDLAPRIRELAAEIIEPLIGCGECDFIGDFALKLPVGVFLAIAGLPQEDGVYLNGLVDDFVRNPDVAAKVAAFAELGQYVDGWIEKRLAEPGDDAISKITMATINGRPYTRAEMLSSATLLVTGGIDSVAMHLSFIALYLARHPSQRDYIAAHLDKLGPIVNELNRRFLIVTTMRKVAVDMEHRGVSLRVGDMLTLPSSIHNFDEELFPNAEEVAFNRAVKPHLTFGTGGHACVGSQLARLEVEIFLEEWLRRIPVFALKPNAPLKLRASITNAVDEMWLAWPTQDKRGERDV